MQVKSLFPEIQDLKLLRAVEQIVLDYQKSSGPVSNVNKAMDFNLKKNSGWSQKAIDYLENNFPNWKETVDGSHP